MLNLGQALGRFAVCGSGGAPGFGPLPAAGRQLSSATPTTFATTAQSTLQTGHGWAAFNNTAGSLNYTGDHYSGTQCIKLTTDGGAVNEAKAQSPRITAFDLTANSLLFWLKADAASFANYHYTTIQVGSGATAWAKVALGNIDNAAAGYASPMRPGEWTPFLLSAASFYQYDNGVDFTAVRDIQVKVMGTVAGAATVLLGGVYLVAKDADYPHGVISISFDDGYASAAGAAKTAMDAVGFVGSAYIVKDVIDTAGFMTAANVATLASAGWEIGGHAYYVADHDQAWGFQGLSTTVTIPDWSALQAWLLRNSYAGSSFAYPHGGFDRTLLTLAGQYWSYGRGAAVLSIETLPVADSLRLRTYEAGKLSVVAPNSTLGTLEWLVDRIYASGGWLVFVFHRTITTASADTDVSTADFTTLMQYIATKGVPVQTVGQVLGVYNTTLQWSDDFTGAANAVPDVTKWVAIDGLWCQGGNELEYMVPANVVLDGNGCLAITAREESHGEGADQRDYTSGAITTEGLFEPTFGRIEASIKVPSGQGLWPAFWLLPVDHDVNDEIDILELLGHEPAKAYSTVHGNTISGVPATWNIAANHTFAADLSDDFHTYAMEWRGGNLRFFVDDTFIGEASRGATTADDTWGLDKPFFLILQLAVGGDWPGAPDETTTFPATMLVDWVRVYA